MWTYASSNVNRILRNLQYRSEQDITSPDRLTNKQPSKYGDAMALRYWRDDSCLLIQKEYGGQMRKTPLQRSCQVCHSGPSSSLPHSCGKRSGPSPLLRKLGHKFSRLEGWLLVTRQVPIIDRIHRKVERARSSSKTASADRAPWEVDSRRNRRTVRSNSSHIPVNS